MGIISVEQLDRLYWLGRYVERVYTTTCLYSTRYDIMIDGDSTSYADFCRSRGSRPFYILCMKKDF